MDDAETDRNVPTAYQRQWLHQEMEALDGAEDLLRTQPTGQGRAKRWLEPVKQAGTVLEFAYSREDNFQADQFAIHLCRNAGFDLERALDFLRRQAFAQDASLIAKHAHHDGSPPSSRKCNAWWRAIG